MTQQQENKVLRQITDPIPDNDFDELLATLPEEVARAKPSRSDNKSGIIYSTVAFFLAIISIVLFVILLFNNISYKNDLEALVTQVNAISETVTILTGTLSALEQQLVTLSTPSSVTSISISTPTIEVKLTDTPTPTPTLTATPSSTPSPTLTPTPTLASLSSPTLTPTVTWTPTPTPTISASATCLKAKLVGETVEDGTIFAPGESFIKVWTVELSGCTKWPAGVQWAFVSGDKMEAEDSIEILETAMGEKRDLRVNMIAPSSAGKYSAVWKMKGPDGKFFGPSFTVKIVVNVIPTPTSSTP